MHESLLDTLFHKEDKVCIVSYLDSNLEWEKNAFLGKPVCANPHSLLMPLMIIRTVGFLKRGEGIAMPDPFDKARIPNFQPFLDRVTIETYPRISTLIAEWTATLQISTVRSYLLALVFIVTQLDFHYVLLLFDEYGHLLADMDVDAIIATISPWFKVKGKCSLFRSRFQSVSMDQFPALLRSFTTCKLPSKMTVADFCAFLQRKESGTKVFSGIGPFHPMVFARELYLYDFFIGDCNITTLGKGQGSYKLLTELGANATLDEMRTGFQSAAQKGWEKHIEMHPNDKYLTNAVQTLLYRTPTDFELENMCCEGRKMLKALSHAVGSVGGDKKKIKKFHGSHHNAPSSTVPLPTIGSEGVHTVMVALNTK